jgi:single-strand DNA-binding protein
MAFGLNSVNVIGNVAIKKDEKLADRLRHVGDDNKAVIDFPLAIDGAGNTAEDVGYVQVTAWNGTAESIAKFLHSGSKVCVQGSLRQTSFVPKGGSERVYKVEIANARVQFLDPPPQNGGSNGSSAESLAAEAAPAATEGSTPTPPADDDIPF